LAGARQAKEARRLEINLEMNRDADHHAQRVPIPAAGAVDEEPPVGMALSGPPSEGPQAAVHAGMALSGPPSEGSQAAVHDEPEDAVTLDLWTYAVKANKPPAEAIWNVLPLEKKMARSLQAHATKVTAPWAAPPLTIERKHVKGRRGRRVTVVKNLFMWYYAAKAATITAGRAESMYHLRVTERAMLPFTNKVVPPYGHTAKLYLLDDVLKAGCKKTSTKVKLGLRVLRALCRTLGIKVESQHDKVHLYKKVCARLMSVRP
jgi:hypothetical protein